MARTPVYAKRAIMRLALVGAVTVGVPVAVADTAEAGPGGQWDRLAKCESSGRWSTNSGNGYYGGLQFSRSTWKAYGGKGMPHRASRSEQVKVASGCCGRRAGRHGPSARASSVTADRSFAVLSGAGRTFPECSQSDTVSNHIWLFVRSRRAQKIP